MPDGLYLDDKKKATLDNNVKLMFSKGASKEEVLAMSQDFMQKFGVKKKDNTVSTSANGSSGFQNPLLEVGKNVLSDFSKPKTTETPVKDGSQKYDYIDPKTFDSAVEDNQLFPKSQAKAVPPESAKYEYIDPKTFDETNFVNPLSPKSKANKSKEPLTSRQDLNEQLDKLTPELISHEEEYVVPQLNQQFKDLGFKFEEAGVGDAMIATAPNGKTMRVSLNHFTTNPETLKTFIKDNSKPDKLTKLIANQDAYNKKFTDQKEIDESFVKLAESEKKISNEFRDFSENKKLLSNAKIQMGLMERNGETNSEEYAKVSQYVAEKEESLRRAEISFLQNENNLEEKKAKLNASVGQYVRMKSDQGTTMGGVRNQVLSALDDITYGLSENEIDLMFWLSDKEKKDAKKMIKPVYKPTLGSENTSDEYVENAPTLQGAVFSLARSAPPMLAGQAMFPVMYLQASANISKEMDSNPAFNDISELEKKTITAPLAFAEAFLEKAGLKGALGQSKYVNNLTLRALGESTKTTTAETFSEILEKHIKSDIARGLLKVGTGGLSEGTTGGLQEIANIEGKTLYNEIKGKELFETPETLWEGVKQVSAAAGNEALGGLILGGVGAMASGYQKNNYSKVSDAQMDILKSVVNDPTFGTAIEADLQMKVNSGEMKPEDAEKQMDDFRQVGGLLNSTDTEGLTNDEIKEALPLVAEINKLEEKKKRLNPAQKKKVQLDIDKVTEELITIGTTKKEQDALTKDEEGLKKSREKEKINKDEKAKTTPKAKQTETIRETDVLEAEPTPAEESVGEVTKVFRGVGKNVKSGENEGITWVAEDKKVAENYSDGQVEEIEITKPKNPFEHPPNVIYVKGSDVGGKLRITRDKLLKEGKITREQALDASDAITEFVEAAGEDVELYSTKTNKKGVAAKYVKALKLLGFDGIVQSESYNSGSPFTATKTGNETNTYGIFKDVPKEPLDAAFEFKKLGTDLWNFDNPIAEKEIDGVSYRITDENKRDSENKKIYTLYKDKEPVGEFGSVQEAKDAVSNVSKSPEKIDPIPEPDPQQTIEESANTEKVLAALEALKSGVVAKNKEKPVITKKVVAPKAKQSPPTKTSVVSRDNLDVFKTIVSKDDMRPHMKGVYFDSEENLLVATDAHKMLMISQPVEKTETVGLKGEIIDGKFPQYKAVIPFYDTQVSNVDVNDLIEKTAPIAKENKGIKYEGDKTMVSLNIDGDVIWFNPQILNDGLVALKKLGYTTVNMGYQQPNRAALFVSPDDKAKSLVMPVMVDPEQNTVVNIADYKLSGVSFEQGIAAKSRLEAIIDPQGYAALYNFENYKEAVKKKDDFNMQYEGERAYKKALEEKEQLKQINNKIDPKLNPLYQKAKSTVLNIIAVLEKAKINTKGTLNAFGVAPAIWNTAIDTAIIAIKGGVKAAKAINEMLSTLRKHKGFDEPSAIKAVKDMGIVDETFTVDLDEAEVEKVFNREAGIEDKTEKSGGEVKKTSATKELDNLINNVPETGAVDEYLSKGTIEKYTGETPSNSQKRGVQKLTIALEHGEKIIAEAKNIFGENYVEKLVEYLENSTAPVSNKALVYVSLENSLGREKLNNPERANELNKLQSFVYEKSQLLGREYSKSLNYQRLRKFAETGYDLSLITDEFFSSEELEGKKIIEEAVQSDIDKINKEAVELEFSILPEDIQRLIEEGVQKEIAEIHEGLTPSKKAYAKRAIKALEEVQKKLRSRTYDATLGIPVAIIDSGIEVIKKALDLGYTIGQAVEAGISTIKKKIGNRKWEKENEFRQDALNEFSKRMPDTRSIVKEALINKGFGRTVNIKGVEKTILDWKKLAGAAGTVEQIKRNVENALKDEGKSQAEIDSISNDLLEEYQALRESIIQKAQTELAKRNRTTVTPKQRSAAKKLAELYNFGLFDKNSDEFETAVIKAVGAKVSEEGFNDAKKIARAMETLYASTFKGVFLNDVSAKAALENLENKLRILLYRESRKQGNGFLRAANLTRNYLEIQQTMILNNLKQAVENPFSGLQQNIIEKISNTGKSTKEMAAQRRLLMKSVFKDMVLNGAIGFGKVETTFVNRQHLDDYVNKVSDNKLYHAIMSVATGKLTLNAMDSLFKASITEKKFTSNLLRILTDQSNPQRMSNEDALKFVSEKLTGQTFEEAKKTATAVTQKINADAGKELMPNNNEALNRLANDIVKSALEMGGIITSDQIEAAYNAAYKSAGLGLGHEANNPISAMFQGHAVKIEGKINQALKEKNWNKAALLTFQSAIWRNMINPFVAGGTNWVVLKFEKLGGGLFTGLGYQIGSLSSSRIDLSSKAGLAKLEKRLYEQSRYKDAYMRGLLGGAVTLSGYLLYLSADDEEEYRKWSKKNYWASRYLNTLIPESILADIAIKEGKQKRYIATLINKNDAFDVSTKLLKAADYSAKGKKEKAWGALGEAVGGKINAPVPWRLVKDGQVIYQGVKGEDPYHGDYKPSEGFLSGVLQGGVIEWLGYRPMPPPENTTPQRREKREKNSE